MRPGTTDRHRGRRTHPLHDGRRTHPLRGRGTLVAAAFVGALAICWSWPGYHQLQADSYGLLYWGRWIAEHGIPHHNVFALAAAGRPFADQQWLSALIDYDTWRLAGYNGLALLTAGVFGSGFALLLALMRRRGASVIVAVACAALALFGTISLTFIRAQIFAIPLFVMLLWLCLDDAGETGPRWRLLLVLPLLALWANLHGSVLIAVALAGAYFAYRAASMARRGAWRPAGGYALLGLGALAMVIATPYGAGVLTYYRDMFGNHALGLADIEWDPPAFPTFGFFQFAVPLLSACAATGLMLRRRRRPPWVLIGALAITALAAAFAMRNVLWLGIVAAALVAETSSTWLPTRETSPRFLAGLAVGALGLLALGVVPLLTATSASFRSHAPLTALAAVASYAAAHPCARVLADNESSSALLWLHPAMASRVEYDSELESYGAPALARWVAFRSADGPSWLAAARGYQLLIGATAYQPALVRRLGRLAGASVLARDRTGIAVLNPSFSAGPPCSHTPDRPTLTAAQPSSARAQEVAHG
jgi:hypothetical protein